MSSEKVFTGVVRGGVFIPDDRKRYSFEIRQREGKPTRVTLGPVKRGRTNPQLDYYWVAVVRPASAWLGLTPGDGQYHQEGEDEMHSILLREVLVPMLPERFLKATPSGDRIQGRGSTTVLSVDEMTAYINRCKHWLAEQGFIVEDIDHVWIRKNR